jgi:hypothetical protein
MFTYEPVPDDVIAQYDRGGVGTSLLVFDPTCAGRLSLGRQSTTETSGIRNTNRRPSP